MKMVASVATALVIMGLSTVGAQSGGALTVRLYNSAGLDVAALLTAGNVAEPIWRDAGMRITVRQCGSRSPIDGTIDRCNDVLKPFEVVARVIVAPHFSQTLGPDVFGVANLLKGTNRGWLASLYSDRIALAETRLDLEPGTLLGRVLAHEVGHLLLGTRYHSQTGLMRADWSDDVIDSNTPVNWRFSTGEAASMQHALATSLAE